MALRGNTLHSGPLDNEFQFEIERAFSTRSGATWPRCSTRVPRGSAMRAEEIMCFAFYPASEMRSFTTGLTLMVEGGSSV